MICKLNSVFLLLVVCVAACGQSRSKKEPASNHVVYSDSATKNNSVSEFFLDSLTLEQFIGQHKISQKRAGELREFYTNRNYEYAWFDESGLAQHTHSFWSLHNAYLNYSRDSSFFNKQLHEQMRKLIDEEDDMPLSANDRQELEMELTDHFFDYAQYAYAGKIDPSKLNWHIPQKKVNAIALLDSLVTKTGKKLDEWEPLNKSYLLLRQQLVRLYEIQENGGWPTIDESNTYRLGDSSMDVYHLKTRLKISGDYSEHDSSFVFSKALMNAVKKAQKRFGLKQDGIAGAQTVLELNVSPKDRIEQILVNMERMRWMPSQKGKRTLVANIPEFKLHVYENNREAFQMKIVVGKAANKTVIFSDQLQYVVFSPYWNVPTSIVRKEILPAMQNDPSYLQRHNMEQVGSSEGLPKIRQKPGSNNALGRVKFIFPNSYNIYFHDTPAKSLFDEGQRAFSHGCIRLAQPVRLAEYLLQDKKGWTDERIEKAMHSGTEKWVKLDEPVPVLITYITAWVDSEGLLNFRDDIYGRDEELKKRLFTE